MEIEKEKKVEIILAFIEENRKQVEWVKDLDFKATQYSIVFILVSIGWLLTNGVTHVPQEWMYAAFSVMPTLAIAILCRNHRRHYKLNRQWQAAAKALQLDKENVYLPDPIVKIYDQETIFHLGRLFYIIPILGTAIGSFFIMNKTYSDATGLKSVQTGDCIMDKGESGLQEIKKIVGMTKDSMTTFSFSYSRGKRIENEDYIKIPKAKTNFQYEVVSCPTSDEKFSPDKYLSEKIYLDSAQLKGKKHK